MSAIAGLLNFDGEKVSQASLEEALQAQAHRIRGASRTIELGTVALAGDDLAIARAEQGGLAIVCDVRLDNRTDLCAELGLSAREPNTAIILAAYAKWGEDCAARLLGDFALAIWDGRREALYCARDHAGVRPFCYGLSNRQFAFASEPKGVMTPGAGGDIDPARIAGYLMGIAPDRTSTWRPGVQRLAPGHWLRLERGKLDVQSHWRPCAPGSFREGEVVEAFSALMTEAVQCRLGGETGAMLSGGLDSSAIAMLAQRASDHPFRTYSMIFGGSADERPQIDKVLAAGRFKPQLIDMSAVGPFDEFERVLGEQDGPFLAPGIQGSRRLYDSAAAGGVCALLDGHGGDEVVSHGLGRLKQLAVTRRWRKLWRNVSAEADVYQTSRMGMFLTYWRFFGPWRGAFRRLDTLFRSTGRGAGGRIGANPTGLLDGGFADAVGAGRRLAEDLEGRSAYRTEIEQHILMLNGPIQPHALEILDAASAHAGIEPRYPFWDKRLVEFCLSLKPEDKLHDGWTRYTLRRAMQGLAPDEIAWRRDKFNFASRLAEAMCRHHAALMDDIILSATSALEGYVDLEVLRTFYLRMKSDPGAAPGDEVQAIWRSVALALWLETSNTQAARRPGQREVAPTRVREASYG